MILFSFASFSLHSQETQGFLSSEEMTLFYKQGYLIKRQALSGSEMKDLNEIS